MGKLLNTSRKKILIYSNKEEKEISSALSDHQSVTSDVMEDLFTKEFVDGSPFVCCVNGDVEKAKEFCRKVRKNNDYNGSTLVVVIDSIDQREMFYKLRADSYIIRPIVFGEVIERISPALSDHQGLDKRTQELISAGIKTSELIHNIQNALTLINGYAWSLANELPDNQKLAKQRNAIQKLKNQVTQFLGSLSSSKPKVLDKINIDQLIKEELAFLGTPEYEKKNIQINLNLNIKSIFRGISVHLSHVFANLIKNAVDALESCDKKTITIESSETPDKMRISITDTGSGIPQEIQEKIFKPFFTTKTGTDESGKPKGSGIGLASCKDTIEKLSGKLWIEKSTPEGTCFVIEIPLSKSDSKVA